MPLLCLKKLFPNSRLITTALFFPLLIIKAKIDHWILICAIVVPLRIKLYCVLIDKLVKIKGADVEQGIPAFVLQVARIMNLGHSGSLEEMWWMVPIAIMSQLPQTDNVSNKYFDLVKTLNVFGSHDLWNFS